MIRNLDAIFTLTLKRLWVQKWLTLATLAGLTVAVALIMTVPLYADAVNFRILEEQLSSQTERNNRPPFAYLYNYIGAWNEPVTWETIEPVTRYLENEGADTLGLPPELFVWHVETNEYRVVAEDGDILASMRFGATDDLQDHVELIAGNFPIQAPLSGDDPLPVMITNVQATEMGVAVGDRLVVASPPTQREQIRVEVEIAGIWQPLDPDSPYWFYAPTSFDAILTLPQASYSGRLANTIENEVHLAVWYWVLDGSRVGTGDVANLVTGAQRVEQDIDSLLPNAQALQSPIESLQSYERAVGLLTRQLTGFNAPTIGLIVAFIGLVVSLAVGQRRNEMAISRSRGGTAGQIAGMALVEGVLLGVMALVLGTGLALWLTNQMGQVRSFLDFSAETQLRIGLNRVGIYAGILAVAIAIIAQVLPTLAVANDTIITYKQEQARQRKAPWWQRFGLDILLFALSAYAIYQLQVEDTLILGGGNAPTSVLENPILLLLPTIAIFSVTLIFLRLLPLVMRLLSRVLVLTNSIGLLQASRYLARSPGIYATPLILLTLTVSLSVFTASLARTFDLQLFDQWFYQVGADVNLLTTPTTSAQNRFLPQPVANDPDFFLPPSVYEEISGVTDAARVGRFPGNVQIGDNRTTIEFVGVDRQDFGQVAYWREDFSAYRFGSLMNGLGRSPDSIIAPAHFMVEHGLQVGDIVPVEVSVSGGRVSLDAEIAGIFDYFPTYYPNQGDPILVGNLNTIFAQVGGQTAYRVWLKTSPDFDFDTFETELGLYGNGLTLWREPRTQIEQTLVQPQRQGVFGLLSVGFIASALLTVLGFFLYATFSFRRRMIELGILRAVGLNVGRMRRFLAWELALLILSGLFLGTTLGVWISQQFIPLLQTGVRQADLVPPYLVEIAWSAIGQIYILFGLMFVLAFSVLSLFLQRMKIFQAVKLGETI